MSEQSKNYDDVRQYRLDPEREQELLRTGGECTFIWANKSGHSLGVTTAYVAIKDKIWMTATCERVRIKAIGRDGRSAIVITSKGTPMGAVIRPNAVLFRSRRRRAPIFISACIANAVHVVDHSAIWQFFTARTDFQHSLTQFLGRYDQSAGSKYCFAEIVERI